MWNLAKSSWWIRFGGGVGKQAWVGSIGAVCLAATAWRCIDPFAQHGCFIGIIVVVIVTAYSIGFHGHKHPDQATLEGMDMVAYLHTQQEYAASTVRHD